MGPGFSLVRKGTSNSASKPKAGRSGEGATIEGEGEGKEPAGAYII